jgi:hypothetical protein
MPKVLSLANKIELNKTGLTHLLQWERPQCRRIFSEQTRKGNIMFPLFIYNWHI